MLIGAVALVAAACGGGSSSVSGPSGSSGGSGSAVVQGQVTSDQTAAGESVMVVTLQKLAGIGIAEAAGFAGVTVNLVNVATNTVVMTTTTDANGNFVFRDVPVGTYKVAVAGTAIESPTFTVGADDRAVVGVVTPTGPATVTVTAMSTDVYDNDAKLGHAVNIANAGGSCNLVQVTALREQGLGWGVIAQRCHVSPGVIGLGRSNLSDSDLDDAREHAGHARVHGNSNGKGKGKGKS
jgi:hypothetical protein